nr:MAG TPA: hypothetical protein [Caudoviricetes sp.]
MVAGRKIFCSLLRCPGFSPCEIFLINQTNSLICIFC